MTRDNVVDQTGASVSMISTDVLMGIDEVKYILISRLCSKTGKEVDHGIFYMAVCITVCFICTSTSHFHKLRIL